VLLLATGAPAGFVYTVTEEGSVLTVSQNGINVLGITLDDSTSGDYTVVQLAAIDHGEVANENNLDFSVNYRVTDSDGDSVEGVLGINVDDDTPTTRENTSVRLDDGDNHDHMVNNGRDDNQNRGAFQALDGDRDYNDVNVKLARVTVSDDVVEEVSFDTDAEGSIDFTLDDDMSIVF